MKVHIFSVMFLGIAVSLDNMCIGFSYGLGGKHIKLINNLIISVISGVFSFLASGAARLISPENVRYSIYIGSALLIVIGAYTIYSALKKGSEVCEKDEGRSGKALGLQEVFLLGVALAINNFAASFAAGLTEIPPLSLSISMTVFSALFMGLGNHMGKKVKSSYSGKLIDILGGFMLLAIGVWELLI